MNDAILATCHYGTFLKWPIQFNTHLCFIGVVNMSDNFYVEFIRKCKLWDASRCNNLLEVSQNLEKPSWFQFTIVEGNREKAQNKGFRKVPGTIFQLFYYNGAKWTRLITSNDTWQHAWSTANQENHVISRVFILAWSYRHWWPPT